VARAASGAGRPGRRGLKPKQRILVDEFSDT
jgi:hypothetical protein